jgi:hypothetical protein
VWFQNARDWFLHAEYFFHKQSVILHAECDFKLYISTYTRVTLTRARVNMNLMSVISTRTRLIPTRRVWLPHAECDFTRRVWFYTQSVLKTYSRVILTRVRVAQDWFLHADYDFHKQSVILHAECDFMHLNMTLTSVISTSSSLISTRSSVTSKRKV